ncbi:MAG TPA: hypothetical protein VFS39_17440 [Nitrospira sp.]|nr:hypothetical protein [Nitrospira sp.]
MSGLMGKLQSMAWLAAFAMGVFAVAWWRFSLKSRTSLRRPQQQVI